MSYNSASSLFTQPKMPRFDRLTDGAAGDHVSRGEVCGACEEIGAGLWTQRYPTRQGVRCAARAALASSFAMSAAQRLLSTEIPGSAPVEGRDSSRSRKMTSRRRTRDDFRGRKKGNCPSKELRQTDHPRRQTENSCPIAHRKGFRSNDHGFRTS
jgi:hypothetical protein